jgi:hypothetical protein
MTDEATVAIALGPAAITAVVAYFGARFQRETSTAETEAATLRVRIAQAEAERARLQGVYHEFMVLLTHYVAIMNDFLPTTEAEFHAWLDKYYTALEAVRLDSGEGVSKALEDLSIALDALASSAPRRDDMSELESFKLAYPAHAKAISDEKWKLLAAMRAEVAARSRDIAEN